MRERDITNYYQRAVENLGYVWDTDEDESKIFIET